MHERPHLNVWELVIVSFVLLSGIRGLFFPPAEGALALLGGWAPVFYGALIASGVTAIVGAAVRGPDGMVVALCSMVTLAIACVGVYAGLVVLNGGNLLYSGAVSILIFAVGAIFRAMQISRQLRQLRRVLESGPPT